MYYREVDFLLLFLVARTVFLQIDLLDISAHLFLQIYHSVVLCLAVFYTILVFLIRSLILLVNRCTVRVSQMRYSENNVHPNEVFPPLGS
ncbi:hypothetical protein GCM10028816_42510 [Spirosoma lituiforme]